jgi:HEAT repeat protein
MIIALCTTTLAAATAVAQDVKAPDHQASLDATQPGFHDARPVMALGDLDRPTARPAITPANDVVVVPSWAPLSAIGPEDSLFSAGREALNRNRFREAAQLFQQLRTEYPQSEFVPSAIYWEAFSRYRIGGTDNLRAARRLLAEHLTEYPTARTHGDAQALATRIDGALAEVGDSRAARNLQTELQSQDCPDGENDVRIAALNALMNSNPERALPILKRVLQRRDPCSAEMRKAALFVVSQQGNGETTAILMDVVSNDPDPEIRGDAVFWLSQSATPEAVPLLDSLLRHSSDPEIREKALFALAQQGGAASAARMRAVIADPTMPTELRANAIFWLGQNDDGETGPYLRELYATLQDEELREQVLFAISQSNDPATGKWLIDIARDQSQPIELRKNALFWAGQSGVGIADLLTLWDAGLDLEMKEQLVFVYSQSEEPEALDKLFEIARTETNQELRENAIFWLGQSDDPRVTSFLEELISN